MVQQDQLGGTGFAEVGVVCGADMASIDSTRRTLVKTLGATTLLGAASIGTVSARRGASAEETIVEIAAGNDAFEELVKAVQRAGLVDALSANRQLTVFAPTDAAFEALYDALGVDGVDDIEVATLQAVLLYHVTTGRRYAAAVVRAPRVSTLTGTPIEVDGVTLNSGQASIVDTDIEASNGVIHVLDGVLLP
jgi:uncharacterized surface protein with fasciclin (FAS1) repeats